MTSLNEKYKIMLIHGELDKVIPIKSMINAKENLKNLGAKVISHTCSNLEHSINEDGINKGIEFIKAGWITAELTKSDLQFYRKKFKKYLNADDYIKRADYLAWNNKYWDLKRLLRYLPKDYELLYNARQLLMSKSYGVDMLYQKYLQNLRMMLV